MSGARRTLAVLAAGIALAGTGAGCAHRAGTFRDASIGADVAESLTSHDPVGANAVRIRVSNGAVTLEGYVTDAAIHQRYVAWASETVDVRRVDDHLRVDAKRAYADAARNAAPDVRVGEP